MERDEIHEWAKEKFYVRRLLDDKDAYQDFSEMYELMAEHERKKSVQQWAKEAGLSVFPESERAYQELAKLCEIAIAHEREACALICDAIDLRFLWDDARNEYGGYIAEDCANLIRSRT